MTTTISKPIVVITGASGNIGSTLAAALKDDYLVVGFDRETDEEGFTIDLTSEVSIKKAFNAFREKYGDKIAAVIHLAAYFDFTGEKSPLYEKVNVQGTVNLLKTLQDFKVERFIFASTMLVHKAGNPGETINEESAIDPKWAYPESKLNAEKAIQDFHGKIPYLILRLSGLYNDSSCVPTLANQIARIYERRLKSYLYAGDEKAGQSFIHEKDLISLFEKSIKYRNELAQEEIILAGEPEAVSYEKLQEAISCLIHGEPSEIINLPPPVAKAGAWIEEKAEPVIPDSLDQGEKPFIRPFMVDMASDHYALDISKAKKLLKWEPKQTIKKVLPSIIQALKNDPKSWYENNKVKLPDWMEVLQNKNLEKVRLSYEKNFRKEHQQTLWARFITIGLGAWLMVSPITMNYQSHFLVVSDFISGILLMLLGFLTLSWRLAPIRWICAMLGLWLLFAPLIFWAQAPAVYLNDTLIGTFIIGLSILGPNVGVARHAAMKGPDIPPGWTNSPSSWPQRIPIIVLAFIGFFISRYMAAYQLGHIEQVWEPFFSGNPLDPKNGTEEIITSALSRAWLVPDAGLGAVVYLLEILTGLIGGSNRWRTMPWMVLLFGFLIVPLGVVSITFIIIQPILLNTWCTLCLIAALIMLMQIPYAFNEVLATCLFLWRRKKAKRPLLRVLFFGDIDENNPLKSDDDNFEKSPSLIIKNMLSAGVSFPWNLVLCLLIGVWLMFTRITLNTSGTMANAEHLIGSLVITVTIISFAESARAFRFLNLILAFALSIVAFIYASTSAVLIASLVCSVILFILTLPAGKPSSLNI